MKKIILTICTAFLLFSATAQEKQQSKDTTIAVTMNINQFRALLVVIDQNIDSKKASKELVEFIQQSARIVNLKPEQPKKEQPKKQ
ncbi:MAG TPA: hypothetical protein VJ552_05285 [Sediminibacterium sp.]|nr:hypothetical protein [Sediminibacterium sp.]